MSFKFKIALTLAVAKHREIFFFFLGGGVVKILAIKKASKIFLMQSRRDRGTLNETNTYFWIDKLNLIRKAIDLFTLPITNINIQ
jgi:hypothetical protein